MNKKYSKRILRAVSVCVLLLVAVTIFLPSENKSDFVPFQDDDHGYAHLYLLEQVRSVFPNDLIDQKVLFQVLVMLQSSSGSSPCLGENLFDEEMSSDKGT